MRALSKVIGAILVGLALVLIGARITGLEPTLQRPGLWLKGELVSTPVTDWSFTDKIPLIQIQTNSPYLLPHSVTINCISYKGAALPVLVLCRRADVPAWPKMERKRSQRSPRTSQNRRQIIRSHFGAGDRPGRARSRP